MQPKTAPDQLDIKTARSVLRAKIISFAHAQVTDRAKERALLAAATASGSPSRAEDLRFQANQVHQTRIGRRPSLRHLAVAYAFALGRPYAAQEAKAAIPIGPESLADDLLDTQPSVNSTMKRNVVEDIKSWLKGEPTAAQRDFANKVASIVANIREFEAAQ